ncbi:transcription termination/antitermination NusG family protein [Aeromicrobium sp. UC242_57]|uniref:transcription termination/antitermination NusG family protein n=1 Tax=Aeromicrobium sp. UC242_57 TaxID=3374624 RepID=UPI00379D91CF
MTSETDEVVEDESATPVVDESDEIEVVDDAEEADEADEAEASEEGADDEAADDGEEPVVDVLQEFKDRLYSQIGDWYVVHTYSGMEKRVKSNLENRVTSLNAEDYIFEVVVPTEEVAEIKNGQRKPSSAPCFPATSWSAWTSPTSRGRRAPHAVRHGIRGQRPSARPPQSCRGREHARPGSGGRSRNCGRSPRSAADEGRQGRVLRLRGRRLRHGRRWTVRHAARDHHRDQHRCTEGQGPRGDLRSRDAGRAQLHPDPEGVIAQQSQVEEP